MDWSFWKEIGRKSIHLSILFVLFAYIIIENFFSKQLALFSISGLLVFFLILEYFRLEHKVNLPYFTAFMRPKEEFRMSGVIYFLTGVIICLAVFEKRIAFAAILMATFGDLSAGIIGLQFGKTRLFRNKTVIGFCAGFIINLIVGFLMLSPFYFILISICMAFTASIIEALSDELDDNLLVPLISGFVGQALAYIF